MSANKKSILSDCARNFLDNYENGEQIPDEIRRELEEYVSDFDPEVEGRKLMLEIENHFAKVYNISAVEAANTKDNHEPRT